MDGLIRYMCEHEALKHQTSVGDMREIFRIFAELVARSDNASTVLADEFFDYVDTKMEEK